MEMYHLEYCIAGKLILVGIKFGDFSQTPYSFTLASFKFGDSGPRLPNVTSPLLCYPCRYNLS